MEEILSRKRQFQIQHKARLLFAALSIAFKGDFKEEQRLAHSPCPIGSSLARNIQRSREEVCFQGVVTTPAGELLNKHTTWPALSIFHDPPGAAFYAGLGGITYQGPLRPRNFLSFFRHPGIACGFHSQTARVWELPFCEPLSIPMTTTFSEGVIGFETSV
jgi:hypothetical protein